MVIGVTIEGISPLLMHSPSALSNDQASTGRKTQKPTPKEDAEAGAYRLDDGTLYQPAEHLEAAMAAAAKDFKEKSTRRSLGNLLPAMVEIEPRCIPHGTKDYEIDSRPVRVQSAHVIRHRPRLDKWSLSFRIILDDEIISPIQLREIVDRAGKRQGIGDFRPACRGKFGKFVVTKWETISNK